MQNKKSGELIRKLRSDKGLTQRQLADELNLSDKTVSKWERGHGYPDVSLLVRLADVLGVNTQTLLIGDFAPNDFVGGNMKKTKYYVCPVCQNLTFCTGHAEVLCCGRKLEALLLQKANADQKLTLEPVENEWYLTSEHPMSKEHYISFVVFANGGLLEVNKQYPEWDLQLRIPNRGSGMLIWYCNQHGAFYQLI